MSLRFWQCLWLRDSQKTGPALLVGVGAGLVVGVGDVGPRIVGAIVGAITVGDTGGTPGTGGIGGTPGLDVGVGEALRRRRSQKFQLGGQAAGTGAGLSALCTGEGTMLSAERRVEPASFSTLVLGLCWRESSGICSTASVVVASSSSGISVLGHFPH